MPRRYPSALAKTRTGALEGVSISAIARVEGIAWNTVVRRLEKAADDCRRFNRGRISGFGVEELQADEIRSFAGSKDRSTWIFAAIEVWSRLSPSTVVGRRSYRNTLALVRDVADRMDFEGLPLTREWILYETSWQTR